VVNRDDLVPRLSLQSVQALADSVLCAAQVSKTKEWMQDDMRSLNKVLELRRRRTVATTQTPAEEEEDPQVSVLIDAGVAPGTAKRALQNHNGDLAAALLAATEEQSQEAAEGKITEGACPAAQAGASASAAETMQPERDIGLPDTAPKWLKSLTKQGLEATSTFEKAASSLWRSASTAIADKTSATPSSSQRRGTGEVSGDGSGGLQATTAPHPEFLVPGQIIHIYRHNGLSRAALADGTKDELRRVSVCTNMLENHMMADYEEALRQCAIPENKCPVWQPFDDQGICACCKADCDWSYVSQSLPQKMLARHHCLACGMVVCDGCSQTRLSHPDLGFRLPVRTCDRCNLSSTS